MTPMKQEFSLQFSGWFRIVLLLWFVAVCSGCHLKTGRKPSPFALDCYSVALGLVHCQTRDVICSLDEFQDSKHCAWRSLGSRKWARR